MIPRNEQAYLVRAWHASQDATSTPEAQQMIAAEQARIHQAFRQLPIQVQFVDHDPYQSFEQMRDQVRSTGQMLVYKGSSETPLWTPHTNWMARAVHDWDHIVRSCDFSMEGEAAAFRHAAACRPGLAPLYLSEIMLQAAIANYQGAFVPQKLVLAPENVQRRAVQMRGMPGRDDAIAFLSQLKVGDALPAKGFRVERVHGTTVYATKGKGRKLYWLTPTQLEPEIIFALQEVTPGSGAVIPGPPAATFKLQGRGNLRGVGAVDHQQLIRLANEASRSSRYRGPQLSQQPSREEILYWLAWNDRNGVFTDEQIARDPEFAENGPLSEETAWELLEEMLADDLAEQGLRGVGAVDHQQLIAWANEASRASRYRGPILSTNPSREALLEWLQWNDLNGSYQDDVRERDPDFISEGPLDAEEAWNLLAQAAADDMPQLRGLSGVGRRPAGDPQAELVWSTSGILRVSTPEMAMVHLAAKGVGPEDALVIVVAAQMLNNEVDADRRGTERQGRKVYLGATGPLQLGEPVIDQRATDWLHKAKRLRSRRSDSLLSSALESAAAFAKKYNQTTYVYEGNSYMQQVFHVTENRSKALNRINNTGAFLFYVTPDLQLYRQQILR